MGDPGHLIRHPVFTKGPPQVWGSGSHTQHGGNAKRPDHFGEQLGNFLRTETHTTLWPGTKTCTRMSTWRHCGCPNGEPTCPSRWMDKPTAPNAAQLSNKQGDRLLTGSNMGNSRTTCWGKRQVKRTDSWSHVQKTRKHKPIQQQEAIGGAWGEDGGGGEGMLTTLITGTATQVSVYCTYWKCFSYIRAVCIPFLSQWAVKKLKLVSPQKKEQKRSKDDMK